MKIITTELLKSQYPEMPVITGVYDMLSRRTDGTVISQAPIIVSGRNLELFASGTIKWGLVPVVEYVSLIEMHSIYRNSSEMLIAHLPVLEPGEYLPAVKFSGGNGEEDFIYIFPVTWIATPYFIYCARRSVLHEQ